MTNHLEIEFKNLLTEDEYLRLLTESDIDFNGLHSQTNLYFDTKEAFLKKHKMGLRIRLLPQSIEFTLKVPTEDANAFMEITDQVTNYQSDLALVEQNFAATSQVLAYLRKKEVDVTSLEKVGELTTIRGEAQLSDGDLLVLDKSQYYGITDYELEMEVTDSQKGKNRFNHFLSQHEIPHRPAKKKIVRMLEGNAQSLS